jgi:hypothetical protein
MLGKTRRASLISFGSGCKIQFYSVYLTTLTRDSTLFLTSYSKTDETRWKWARESRTRHGQIQSVRPRVSYCNDAPHVSYCQATCFLLPSCATCFLLPSCATCFPLPSCATCFLLPSRATFLLLPSYATYFLLPSCVTGLTATLRNVFPTTKLHYVFLTAKLRHVFPTAKLRHVLLTAKMRHVFLTAKLCHVFPTAKLEWRVCRQLSGSTEISPAWANNSIFSARKEITLLSFNCDIITALKVPKLFSATNNMNPREFSGFRREVDEPRKAQFPLHESSPQSLKTSQSRAQYCCLPTYALDPYKIPYLQGPRL